MFEIVLTCGNCDEKLTATATIENGGCRVVFNINEHTCFSDDHDLDDATGGSLNEQLEDF